jgi:hypothetical protein
MARTNFSKAAPGTGKSSISAYQLRIWGMTFLSAVSPFPFSHSQDPKRMLGGIPSSSHIQAFSDGCLQQCHARLRRSWHHHGRCVPATVRPLEPGLECRGRCDPRPPQHALIRRRLARLLRALLRPLAVVAQTPTSYLNRPGIDFSRREEPDCRRCAIGAADQHERPTNPWRPLSPRQAYTLPPSSRS